MATCRDKNRRWTKEASEFCRNIEHDLKLIYARGRQMGFTDTDIMYMVYDGLNIISILNIMEETGDTGIKEHE